MAEFIVKVGLDSSSLITGLDAAAQRTGGLSSGLTSLATQAGKAGQSIQAAASNGGAFDGLKSKVTSLGSSFSDLGKTALGVFGGGALVAGIGGIGQAFGEILQGAREADDAADSLSISLAKAGLSGAELVAEQERLSKSAKQIGNDFAVPTTEVAKLQAKIAGFSGATGGQLNQLTEFSLGAANALQLPAESVAKLLGKAADPEATAKLKSLGIEFDKNATASEKMEIINRKLGPTIQATKDSTKDAIGAFDRITNSVRDFGIQLASGLFDTLGPTFTALASGIEDIAGDVIPALTEGIGALQDALTPVVIAIKDGLVLSFQTAWSILQPVITGLYNAFVNIRNAIFPVSESSTSLKDILQTIAPIITGVTIALTAYYGIMGLLQARTILVTQAKAAYAFVSTGLTSAMGAVTAAQTFLNAAMAANPIGAVVVAIAALSAGLFLAYQKSETFRNIVQSLFDWVKKVVQAFVDFQLRFNPIINLFKLAYENIKPFRDAVDWLVGKVMNLWEAVKGLAGSIAGLFSSAGATPAVTKKTEPTEQPVENKSAATASATDSKTEEEKKKTKFELAKKQLELEIASLSYQSQLKKEAIEADAVANNRALTEAEKIQLLREELDLTTKIEQKTKELFNVTGEGATVKIGLRLTAKEKDDAQKDILNTLAKISQDAGKIKLEIAKTTEDDRKKAAEAAKKAYDQFEEEAKKRSEKAKKDQDEAEKKAEEKRKADIEIRLNGITNEKARELAFKIFRLEEERRAILRSENGTAQQRLEAAKRFQAEIDALRAGKSDQVDKDLANLDKEELALKAQLGRNKISYEEYSKAIIEIDRKRADIQKQIAENKAAAELAAQTVGLELPAEQAVNRGLVLQLDETGLQAAKDSAAAAFAAILQAGGSFQDGLRGIFSDVRTNIGATFDDIAQTSANALDFRGKGLLDSVGDIATVFGASFASAENAGKGLQESLSSAFAAINTGISGQLAGLTASFDEQFRTQAEQGTVSFEALGAGAATLFGGLITQGANAIDALKQTTGNIIGKLLQVYVAPIIASTLAFLGPFAVPVATAAIAGLQGLLQTALAQFQDGGYTGNGGTSDVAGIVHGQEFVHTAEVTRRNRALFEHLHRGGELSSWIVSTAGTLQTTPIINSPRIDTYGIEVRLDRLEQAITKGNRKFDSMRSVQMTVTHDPTLTIKAQNRNLQIRNARI